MVVRIMGLVIALGGFAIVWTSFRLDRFGLGESQGIGAQQLLMTGFGFLMTCLGGLMVTARQGRRR